jgi:glycerol uptake facilitator-like aquaporin
VKKGGIIDNAIAHTILLGSATHTNNILFTLPSLSISLSGNVENGFHAFLVEAFGTGFLCFCIFMATSPKTAIPPAAVPLLVGVAIGLMVALLGPLTG